MKALFNYMHELSLMDECVIHGKEYIFRHRILGKATKNMVPQEFVYYCIACLQNHDNEAREVQKELEDRMMGARK